MGTTRSSEKTISIVIAGVGGQGILLASEVTARTAILCGLQVKTNEVHGMAQRGGSVLAQIRYGSEVYSPLVAEGAADVLLSLEAVEALRFHTYLRLAGVAIVSRQRIIPVTVSSGSAEYPEPEQALREVFPGLHYLDALVEAQQLGEPRAANMVLVGAMAKYLALPLESWEEALKECVKAKALESNRAAFRRGLSLAETCF